MVPNTDHIVEGNIEDQQGKRLGGGGISIVAHAYKGLGVLVPRKDGPIAQPAQKRCCNIFHFISFHFARLMFGLCTVYARPIYDTYLCSVQDQKFRICRIRVRSKYQGVVQCTYCLERLQIEMNLSQSSKVTAHVCYSLLHNKKLLM